MQKLDEVTKQPFSDTVCTEPITGIIHSMEGISLENRARTRDQQAAALQNRPRRARNNNGDITSLTKVENVHFPAIKRWIESFFGIMEVCKCDYM